MPSLTPTPGSRLGPYEILTPLGAGGPAYVRAGLDTRELRRGLAEARTSTR